MQPLGPEQAPSDPVAPRLRIEPLWLRVDRNRLKLVVFVTLFVVGSAALLAGAMIGVPGTLLGFVLGWTPFGLPTLAAVGLAVSAGFLLLLVIGAVLCAVQLANAEDWVRARVKGKPAKPGEALAFAEVLGEMSIAAGLAQPPSLVVVPSKAVNAYAVGTTRRRPLVGVTRGLLAEMTEAEQRAVAAGLVARIVSGDILFGTALAALMGPVRAFRDMRASGADMKAAGEVASDGCGCAADGCSGCSDVPDLDGCGAAIFAVLFIALVAALTYAAVWIAAHMVTLWGTLLHRTGHEKSDVEGMLLLKEPDAMVSALAKTLRSSNEVIAGDESYDGIFYTANSGKPGLEDAERRRLRRLCEVLGVDGAHLWSSVGTPGTGDRGQA